MTSHSHFCLLAVWWGLAGKTWLHVHVCSQSPSPLPLSFKHRLLFLWNGFPVTSIAKGVHRQWILSVGCSTKPVKIQLSPKALGAKCLVYFASISQLKLLHFSFGKFNAVCFSSDGHAIPIGRECILLALTERKTCNVFRKCNCWDSCWGCLEVHVSSIYLSLQENLLWQADS